MDFVKVIKPMLERSCAGCHRGKEPKGNFRVTSRDALIAGGESGNAAVAVGNDQESPLVRFVSDLVEDLEMPPLASRKKYPALTKDQIAQLRTWIRQGAAWPKGVALDPPK